MEKYRMQLDEIDKKMLELFTQRLDVVKEIAKYKKTNNINVLDKNREKEIITKGLNRLSNQDYKQYYKQFIELQLEISKHLQDEIISEL